MFGQPFLLGWYTHRDEQDIGAGAIDFVNHDPDPILIEVAMMSTRYFQSGNLFRHLRLDLRRYPGRGAEQINRKTLPGGPFTQLRKQVGAVQIFPQIDAVHLHRQPDPAAVR